MDKEIIFVVEESAEGGYEAKALGHSIKRMLSFLQAFLGKKAISNRRQAWPSPG